MSEHTEYQRGRDEVIAAVEAVLTDPEFHIEVAIGGSDYVRRVVRAALSHHSRGGAA